MLSQLGPRPEAQDVLLCDLLGTVHQLEQLNLWPEPDATVHTVECLTVAMQSVASMSLLSFQFITLPPLMTGDYIQHDTPHHDLQHGTTTWTTLITWTHDITEAVNKETMLGVSHKNTTHTPLAYTITISQHLMPALGPLWGDQMMIPK